MKQCHTKRPENSRKLRALRPLLGLNTSHIFLAGHRRRDRVPHLRGRTPQPRNRLEGIVRESGCFLAGKGGHQIPLSRRDILRIARRFNAGKHPAGLTSPEGTAEGLDLGSNLTRPFGTRDLLASSPTLKRWAILDCPFGTAKRRPFSADKAAPVFSGTTCR